MRLPAVLLAVALVVLPGTQGTAGAVPPAPTPTSTAISPDAPDPHPPAGGLGDHTGGARLLSRGLVLPAGATAPQGQTAAAWILADLDSGDVLAAQDPHGRYQPASILKILTSVTLLPMLPGTRTVTVSRAAASAEGSAVGLVEGGQYTVDELFTGLLLMSGNDAAAALADAAGGVPHTVDLMNAEAARLGADDTLVQTPSGLDGWQQLTSAYDMALFLRAAVNLPRFVAYDRQLTGSLPAQQVGDQKYGPVPLANQTENFLDHVPGALVAKIGFTDAASHTYLAAASRGGRRLGLIFLRAQKYPVDQWQQAATLFDWGFAQSRGKSVGTLDAPTPPAVSTPPAPPTPTPVRQSVTKKRSPVGYGLAAVLLVGLGLLLFRSRRRP